MASLSTRGSFAGRTKTPPVCPSLVDRRSFNDLLKDVEPRGKSTAGLARSRSAWRRGLRLSWSPPSPWSKTRSPSTGAPTASSGSSRWETIRWASTARGNPAGSSAILEDENGDGIYDKQTTFLEGLGFPTGLLPWRARSSDRVCPGYFLRGGQRRRRQGRHSRSALHRLHRRQPAASAQWLRAWSGRLGLRGQRRQRRERPVFEDREVRRRSMAAISGFGPTPANSRPRAARRSMAGTATTGATGSATTIPTGPGITCWPTTTSKRNTSYAAARPAADARARHAGLPSQPHARAVQRPGHGGPRHLGQQRDALSR